MPIEIIDRRRLDAICGKLPVGPGPDPAGKKGPWGICPECGAIGYCYWDEKTDTRTCMTCEHKDNGTDRLTHGRNLRPRFERAEMSKRS